MSGAATSTYDFSVARRAAVVPWYTHSPRLMITTASTVCSISRSRWLATSTVRPLAANPRRNWRNQTMPSGSRPLAGSSSTSTCGLPSSAEATARRCRMPSE